MNLFEMPKTDTSKSRSSSYQDYANKTEDELRRLYGAPFSKGNFPAKLHYMLSEIEEDGEDHIISWNQHGRSFRVHDRERLQTNLLPLWFSQKKLGSFLRQLSFYGFQRFSAGPDKGSYYHELFLRGKQHLAHYIPRIDPRRGKKGNSKPQSEPRGDPLVATGELLDLSLWPPLPPSPVVKQHLSSEKEIADSNSTKIGDLASVFPRDKEPERNEGLRVPNSLPCWATNSSSSVFLPSNNTGSFPPPPPPPPPRGEMLNITTGSSIVVQDARSLQNDLMNSSAAFSQLDSLQQRHPSSQTLLSLRDFFPLLLQGDPLRNGSLQTYTPRTSTTTRSSGDGGRGGGIMLSSILQEATRLQSSVNDIQEQRQGLSQDALLNNHLLRVPPAQGDRRDHETLRRQSSLQNNNASSAGAASLALRWLFEVHSPTASTMIGTSASNHHHQDSNSLHNIMMNLDQGEQQELLSWNATRRAGDPGRKDALW